MLCVDCGEEVPKTIQGSCPNCFVATTPLLSTPEVLDVELCAHCDARHIGKKWFEAPKEADHQWLREDAVRGAVAVHARVLDPFFQMSETAQDDKHFRVQITMEGTVEGVDVTDGGEILVRQKRGVCDRCSRMAGNYYASILQLRATERNVGKEELERAHKVIGEELDRQQDAGNRFAFLTKGGPIHGGWDYYLGDIEAGRQVARMLKQRLGASVQETAKLVGRREGDDVYRVTFLVRVALFSPGDFGLWGEVPVQVISMSKGHVHCIDMLKQSKTRLNATSIRRLGGPEEIIEAVLVSESETELQLMDPVSYHTQDVLRPDKWKRTGDTVQVLRHEERMYVAPRTQAL
jgi:nonsense-mediated mRNA decay protein 3